MVKEGSSDYKKLRQRWFFKYILTEWFFVEPKMALLWHRCEEPFNHPFKPVIDHVAIKKIELYVRARVLVLL